MTFYNNLLELIGNTPIIRVNNLDTGPCELLIKLESQNPGGSIKDRIALKMIEAAEKEGHLKPGATIVEATAGNTGIALAMVAALKGYKMLVVMPDKMSQEKVFHLRALGAEVIMTRSDVTKGHPEYYQEVAERLTLERKNTYYINQFANPHNPEAHAESTGPEIWSQLEGKIDAIVLGVGTGGTLTGVGHYLKKKNPAIDIILADPEGSILCHYIKTGELLTKSSSWLVEGVGEDFIPSVSDLSIVNDAITVSDADSFHAARLLLQKEGIFAGSSSGTLLHAALSYCQKQTKAKRVLTFACDGGGKYLSKMYNDYWMIDQGFIKRELFHDLRDIITRRHSERAIIQLNPDEPLTTAFKRMKMHDVSQLPVMENDHIVGIVDESDLLLSVHNDSTSFTKPIREFMTKNLELIDYTAPIEKLLDLFKKGHVAIVMDQRKFFGFITKIDLLTYLRRTMP